VVKVLDAYKAQGVEFHALRTRQAAARRFVSMHVLVPGAWTVKQGHDLVEHLEHEIAATVPGTNVFTHIEPKEDPASYNDLSLDHTHPEAKA
jgi:divalent metal cation (Fe/Co/Zn/Cd) transporter